jgi:hypothetical protein
MGEKGNQPTNQLVALLHRVKDLGCHFMMDLYGYMHCNKKQTNMTNILDVCATNFNPFVLAKDLHNFSANHPFRLHVLIDGLKKHNSG